MRKNNKSAVRRQQANGVDRQRRLFAIFKTRANKIILLSVLILASVYGAKYAVTKLDLFPIKAVHIEGEFRYLDEDAVRQKLVGLVEDGFFSVDIQKLREVLLTMEWVDDAFVRRDWPESLLIRVVEKQPVAKWKDVGLLSAKGELFLASESKTIDGLVVLDGPKDRYTYVLKNYNQMQSILRQVDLRINRFAQDDRRSWSLQIENGITIKLGREDTPARLTRFVKVYEKVIAPRMTDISHVDMRYTNGFVIGWKQRLSERDMELTGFTYLQHGPCLMKTQGAANYV